MVTELCSRRFIHLRESLAQIWLICRKDFSVNLKTYKIPTALAVITLLFVVSALVSEANYRSRLANWTANQEAQQRLMVSGKISYHLKDGSIQHNIGVGKAPPVERPHPLSVLVKGTDFDLDREVSISSMIGFGSRQDYNALSTLFDTPDFSFVVKFLVSLFGLLFSLDAITREKEDGTLGATLAHGAGRREILCGKAIGASASLSLVLMLAYSIGIAYLYSSGTVAITWAHTTRILLLLAMSMVYGLVFVLLGLFISISSLRTKNATASGLLCWGALVLVLPNAALLAAKILSPVPSYSQLDTQMWYERRLIQREARSGSVDSDPQHEKDALFRTFEIEKRLVDDFMARKSAQIEKARQFAVLCPPGAVMFGLSELAGTGTGAYRSYSEFVLKGRDRMIESYKRAWDLPNEQGNKILREVDDSVKYSERPTEPLTMSLRMTVFPLISLILWGSLLSFAAIFRFQRYDVQ